MRLGGFAKGSHESRLDLERGLAEQNGVSHELAPQLENSAFRQHLADQRVPATLRDHAQKADRGREVVASAVVLEMHHVVLNLDRARIKPGFERLFRNEHPGVKGSHGRVLSCAGRYEYSRPSAEHGMATRNLESVPANAGSGDERKRRWRAKT